MDEFYNFNEYVNQYIGILFFLSFSFIFTYFLIKYNNTDDVEYDRKLKEKHEKNLQILMWFAIIPTVLLLLLVLYKVYLNYNLNNQYTRSNTLNT